MAFGRTDVLAVQLQQQPDGFAWTRMEIAFFNCPQWWIAVDAVFINGADQFEQCFSITEFSCHSLVRVCIPFDNPKHLLTFNLSFLTFVNSHTVYVAEISFHRECSCPEQLPQLEPTPSSEATPITPTLTTTSSTPALCPCDGAGCKEEACPSSTPLRSLRVALGTGIPLTLLVTMAVVILTVSFCKKRVCNKHLHEEEEEEEEEEVEEDNEEHIYEEVNEVLSVSSLLHLLRLTSISQ